MINVEDQESLFKLISEYLEKDVSCIAIGGTAMMFLGYKNTTKDIDLVFKNKEDRDVFIKAIGKLGYSQGSIKFIYKENQLRSKNKPLMYTRGEERFDIFVDNVFGFSLDSAYELITQRHDYIGKKELIIYVLNKEYIFLLKSVTNRDKDLEDMETIAKTEPSLDLSEIVSLAIKERKNNPWLLIDLEEKMQKLKKVILIKKEHFDRIYKAENAIKIFLFLLY